MSGHVNYQHENSMLLTAKLSISVIVHNGGSSFRHCLSRLAEAVHCLTEIIVVADGGIHLLGCLRSYLP